MKNKFYHLTMLTMLIALVSYGKENVGGKKAGGLNPKVVAGCLTPTAKIDMEINNVRCGFTTGGDQWWDPFAAQPRYEIPINSGKHSIYASSVWVGGLDASGNIKVAAQTYRQTGLDFWPGAVDKSNASITPQRCAFYDRFWKISKEEVLATIANPATATNSIKDWPGNGDQAFNEELFLAPFYDANGNGEYNVAEGDYPYYNFNDTVDANGGCNDFLFGDQTIWWVINDVGNDHTATLSTSQIGLEIQCQAFAFRTNDEINNMTFCKYKIINRGSLSLDSTYFGYWVDPDLGQYQDDYVGCDIDLGLGFVYNSDNDDEGAGAYGANPPSIGVDFFQGPLADPNDGIDNDKDGQTDEPGEQIIMSKYMYYINVNATPNGNPDGPQHHYNYLTGAWGNGQLMTYGEDGFNPANEPTDYMFSWDTDPSKANNPFFPWSEHDAANPPGDRRFLQSAGEFTLLPGAVNYITIGAVWAKAASGGQLQSVALMKLADFKAQAVFDNCFKVIDGPRAPDLAIRELDREVILTLEDYASPLSEFYNEVDVTIPKEIPMTVSVPGIIVVNGDTVNTNWDSTFTLQLTDDQRRFKFEGYLIYQLASADVTYDPIDLNNPDRARLLAQVDVKNGVSQIINHVWNGALNDWDDIEMVNGADNGIKHVFRVKKDLFAGGEGFMTNYKTYYYVVIAYAYNNYLPFMNTPVPSPNNTQQKPYLAGRLNVRTYTAIPHKPEVQNGGTVFNSQYGDRSEMQRIEGQGNGGLALSMTAASINEAVTSEDYRSYFPVYSKNASPVNISVFDPVRVKPGVFDLRFDGVTENVSNWGLKEASMADTIKSEYPYGYANEQVISEFGLTADIRSVAKLDKVVTEATSPILSSTISYSGPKWLDFLADVNGGVDEDNWILSNEAPYLGIDDDGVFEGILGGRFAPFMICNRADTDFAPRYANSSLVNNFTSIDFLASTQLVMTSDQSKWTRCAVLDMNDAAVSEKMNLRKDPSIDKNGNKTSSTTASDNPNDANFVAATGMGWFPGYAVNLETGERLNIAYSENSALDNDMKWNPTSDKYDATGKPVIGNMHYIYIFGHNGNKNTDVPRYDHGRVIYKLLASGNAANKRGVFKDCMWVGLPMLAKGNSLNSGDITVKINVAKTYKAYDTRNEMKAGESLTAGVVYEVRVDSIEYNGAKLASGSTFTAVANAPNFTGYGTVVGGSHQNNQNPFYKFNTDGLQITTNDEETAKSALDLMNVVPNPYYGYSAYEKNQLDNTIKITNLPSNCVVTIMNTSGIIIRKFKRAVSPDVSNGGLSKANDNLDTSIEWDLKNSKGVPVASGIYLIHVDVEGVGSRVLKSMLIMRPVDIDTF